VGTSHKSSIGDGEKISAERSSRFCVHLPVSGEKRIEPENPVFPGFSGSTLVCEQNHLALFRQFAQRAQTASANIHCFHGPIDFHATALHIQHKAAAGAAL